MPPLETASALQPVSPRPAQVADDGMDVDGMGGFNFRLALFFFFFPIFLSSMLLPTLSVAALPFLSFYLLFFL
jgi:hypothetical protein